MARGDIFGIIGKSGAGKSTLIRCLAGLDKPQSGKILIEGEDIVPMSCSDLRRFRKKIGMIFQHFNLLSCRSVAGNVSYPLEVHGFKEEDRKARVDEVLHLVGLEHKRDVFPARLSGGQKQRVGIARALAAHPDVLLCDEATSALDPQTTLDILSLLKELNLRLGLTIILITHEMGVVKRICNKVAVLDGGRIVESGAISRIYADPQHAITKQFLQHTIHDIPNHLFAPSRQLFRLTFRGKETGEPIITRMIKTYDIEVNILLGWIDAVEGMLIGNMVIATPSNSPRLAQALRFLETYHVHVEQLAPEEE